MLAAGEPTRHCMPGFPMTAESTQGRGGGPVDELDLVTSLSGRMASSTIEMLTMEIVDLDGRG